MSAEMASMSVHQLMDPWMLWMIWQTQCATDTATMAQLGRCRAVCRVWRTVMTGLRGGHGERQVSDTVSVPDWVGENRVFTRYRVAAVTFICDLTATMCDMWRDGPYDSLEFKYVDNIEYWEDCYSKVTLFLAKGLQAHLHHSAAVRACLFEIRDLVFRMDDGNINAESILACLAMPLFHVLQAHHGDSSLGWHVMGVMQIIESVRTTSHCIPLIPHGPQHRMIKSILINFVNSCPRSTHEPWAPLDQQTRQRGPEEAEIDALTLAADKVQLWLYCDTTLSFKYHPRHLVCRHSRRDLVHIL